MSSADSGDPRPASPPSAGLPSSILFFAMFVVMSPSSVTDCPVACQSTGIRYDEIAMLSWSDRDARLMVFSESGR